MSIHGCLLALFRDCNDSKRDYYHVLALEPIVVCLVFFRSFIEQSKLILTLRLSHGNGLGIDNTRRIQVLLRHVDRQFLFRLVKAVCKQSR